MATELQEARPDVVRAARIARIARIAVPLAIVAALIAVRPEIATGTFSSVTSVARVIGLVALWMGFSWLVRRFVPHAVARIAIIGVAGAGLAAFTLLPYFQDETVDDPFPFPLAAPAPSANPGVETTPAVVSTPNVAATPSPTSPSVPAGPQKLAAGELRGLAGHRGAGQAAMYRQPDGSLLVRLEDFDVSSVPAPVVYLVPGANQQRPGGAKLGDVRGNNGNQNFTVPAGTDVRGPQTVLIWCEAFSVPVAGTTATPT